MTNMTAYLCMVKTFQKPSSPKLLNLRVTSKFFKNYDPVMTLMFNIGNINRKVQVGNDQEKAQSERYSHSKIREAKKLN